MIARLVYFIGWLGSLLYATLYHRYRVYGRRHCPPAGRGAVLAANHASYVDPTLIGIAFYHRIWYLARNTLFEGSRLARWILINISAIPISRERLDLSTLRRLQQLCADGQQIVIFPEGTRTPDGALHAAHAGVGLLADALKVDIVPVYLHGTYEAFPRHSAWPRPKQVVACFGPSLPIAAYHALPRGRERYERIAQDIMAAITKLQTGLLRLQRRRTKANANG